MNTSAPNRILHLDGDSFFASCEIALNPNLQGRPVWVGGGRRGDGIVIAANRPAKQFGVQTGMACFEAARLCPRGVLCRPQYDEYRRLSQAMFRVLEEYTPTLVPVSIDEGFLDFTTMDRTVWRHTTAAGYVREICDRIGREVGLPVSAGLASSSRLAKLATDAAKPGFIEIPAGEEKEFLRDRSVRELSGIAVARVAHQLSRPGTSGAFAGFRYRAAPSFGRSRPALGGTTGFGASGFKMGLARSSLRTDGGSMVKSPLFWTIFRTKTGSIFAS